MVFATSSDPIVTVAFWVGVATVVFTLALLAAIIILRYTLNAQRAQHLRVVAAWQPVLMQAVYGMPQSLPELASRDLRSFLDVWTHFQESLRGDAKENLNLLAYQVRANTGIHTLLRRASFRDRLQAIVAAGHLRDEDNWDLLRGLLDHGSPVLSLAAARALLQIDAQKAVGTVLFYVASRADWPSSRVASMLKEAGSATISRPLADMALRAIPDVAPRLIRFLALTCPKESGPAVRELLRRGQDDHVTSTCLQVLTDPQEIDTVRQFATHPRWHVRVQAASALGRMGMREDAERLERMLGDEQWWVRYRAAQALAALPFMDNAQLEIVRARQTDRYARDMMSQILAERGVRPA